MLNLSKTDAEALAKAVTDAHTKIHYCAECCNLTDKELCPVCANPARDKSVICVVETPRDASAIEKTHEYNGVYHILHGSISPLNGIGPDNITIKQLLARFNGDDVKEVIMATNPTVEGDATALYISKLLKPLGVKVTRLAYGIPSEEILSMPMNTHLQRLLKAGVKYNGFIKNSSAEQKGTSRLFY